MFVRCHGGVARCSSKEKETEKMQEYKDMTPLVRYLNDLSREWHDESLLTRAGLLEHEGRVDFATLVEGLRQQNPPDAEGVSTWSVPRKIEHVEFQDELLSLRNNRLQLVYPKNDRAYLAVTPAGPDFITFQFALYTMNAPVDGVRGLPTKRFHCATSVVEGDDPRCAAWRMVRFNTRTLEGVLKLLWAAGMNNEARCALTASREGTEAMRSCVEGWKEIATQANILSAKYGDD